MQRKNSQSNLIPGPKGHLLLGSIAEFKKDPLNTLEQGRKAYGNLVRFRLGPKDLYVASSPELAEDILVKQKAVYLKIGVHARKPIGLQLLFGNGLFTNRDPESWLIQRRLMQPMYHLQSIATMSDKMVMAGQRLLRRWQEDYEPGDGVDVSQEMMQVTLDIISQTMFSTDVLEQTTVIGQAVSVGIAFIFRRMHNPLSLPLMLPTPSNLSFKRARQVLDRVVYAIIDARLQTGEQHHDLLDMLISARDADTGQGMSREQLRDEVVTIFLAGHETTANGLTWAWYLLSQHPAHLHALQHEVDTVLQGRPPTIDDLKNLPYTAAVFDEALRLRPPAPLLPRRVAQNTALGDYDLAAGSQVMVNIYGIHHHPDLWEEPEAFKPERFLPGMSLEHHKLAYMPFGAGQHKCIGSNFALVEAQLLLALIAQHYELRLAPDQRIEEELGITLRPRSGMRMTLHPRA